MRKETLGGLTQKTHQILKGDDPQFLCLQNISVGAKLKTEIKRERGNDSRLFNTINVALLNEAQNKIESYLNGKSIKQFSLKTVADADAGTVVVVEQANIDLAYSGELLLNQNDSVDNYLTNLGKVVDSWLFSFEGKNVSPAEYIVKEQTYKKEEIRKGIDLRMTQFLILDATALPSEIDFRINGEKLTRTSEALLIDQIDRFNVIGFDENGKAIFGTYKAVVLDVRGAESVYLEDSSEPRTDIKFYSVKTPY